MKRNRRFAGLFVCLLGAALTAGTRSLAATAAKPTFSQGHGFYSSSFSVRISSATAGATIRYTTDGSAPGTSAGTVLANGGSVTINTTTCLRACAVSAGMTTSQPFTQTYIFLSHVLTQTKPAGYPSYWSCTDSGYPATRPADYNMDSVVVNDSRYKGTIQNDLKSIPSLSIVMKRTDLFGASGGTDGVYMQGGYTGGKNTLEKPGSVELIYPDGRAGFQIDCGIKPHSGCDHKRSLRLLFKSNYGGPVKLDYPFYEDAPMNRNAGPNTFGKIFLRAGCNESWSTWWNLIDGKKAWVAYIRDQFTRNSFIDMTGRGGRNLFVHLYLNGMYWGIYDACERPDARFAADRWGGSKADWFARNTAGTISGSATRWNYLHSTLVPAGGFANASKYNTVKQYLDIEDFCDYIILNWYVGTDDWPGNNYYVVNRNNPAGPLLYLCWDADTSWGVPWGGGCNPDGAWVHPAFTASGHKHDNRENAKLWRALDDNTDFLITFADRFYKHGYNGGELTDANARARWDTLAAAVERAVVGESARWGDALMASHGQPRYTLDDHWKPARTAVRNMITGNTDTLKSAMRAVGYYPSIDPPTYQQHGGTVAAGFKLTISRSQTGTIYYRTDGSDPRVSGGGVLSGTPASTSPVVLTLDSTTTVKARLKNAATWSALAEATFTVTGSVPQPPAAPGGLAAAAQSVSEIRLTWTDNSSNETGFKIERSPNGSSSWSQIATPTANATTYTDSGLAAAATFYYRVRAYNGAGNSPYSGIAGATTQQGLPAAPGGLAAAAQSVSEIRLTWTDNSGNETGFKIERSPNGSSSWSQIATPTANATTYTDSGLAAATTYYYRVRAYNAAGNSAYSAIAGATTQEGLPAAPSGLSATAVSASRIDLGWTDNSNNETGFKIDRRRSGTDVWDRIAEPGAGATAYSDSGLPANTLFYYQVKAYNAAGNSAYSGIAGATTQEGLPAAPDGLTATAVSASRVDLGWTDNSNNETGFKIDRRMSHTAAWVRIAETGAGVTSYADSALPAGVKFYYTIKAFNAGGNSAEAGPADATTPGPIAYTAYNDLAWASGQLAVNITTYTRDESGTLKDYATGSALGARLTVNGGGYGPALTQGTNPALETDADSVFGGIVDAAGLISYGDSDLVLTFSGLDPTLRYEVALFGNRAGGYSDRVTTVSLSDASSFANASSAGTQFSGPADASTEINTGENTAEGYLAWYVAIDPGSDGDLVLTLSGYEYANALMLKAVGTPSTPPADFTAYNDLAWFAGQPSANITTYTTTNEAAGRVRSGLLLDYASGRRTDVRLTVDGGLGVFDQGLHPASGTDAHGVFGGKLDAAGTVSYGTEDLTLTFSGLEPTRRYELVLYADRNGAGYVGDNARGHYGTLTEAASFENASTPGTCKVVDVANHQPDDTTLYNAGYNNTAGYVTRFRSIEPGADGTIVLRLKQGAEPTYAAYFGRYYTYANAVMLRTQPDSFLPPDQDADSDAMADAWETAHFGGTDAANGGAQDDFDGDGMSNADEYVAGTDPAGSAAYFAVAVELTGAKIVVSVPTVAASGPAYTGLTRRYAIEQQDVALGAWQAVAGYADFSATGATVAYTNAGAGGATLYRGKVWLREE